MMYLYLGTVLSFCPKFWQNFVSVTNPNGNSIHILHKMLNKYEAIFIDEYYCTDLDEHGKAVMFPSDDAFIKFKSAWD